MLVRNLSTILGVWNATSNSSSEWRKTPNTGTNTVSFSTNGHLQCVNQFLTVTLLCPHSPVHLRSAFVSKIPSSWILFTSAVYKWLASGLAVYSFLKQIHFYDSLVSYLAILSVTELLFEADSGTALYLAAAFSACRVHSLYWMLGCLLGSLAISRKSVHSSLTTLLLIAM